MLTSKSSMQSVGLAHMSLVQLEIRLQVSGLKRGCHAAEPPFHAGARAFTLQPSASCRVS